MTQASSSEKDDPCDATVCSWCLRRTRPQVWNLGGTARPPNTLVIQPACPPKALVVPPSGTARDTAKKFLPLLPPFTFFFVINEEEDQLVWGDLNQKGKNDSKYSPCPQRCSTSLPPSTLDNVSKQKLFSCRSSKETEAGTLHCRPRTFKAGQPIAGHHFPYAGHFSSPTQ